MSATIVSATNECHYNACHYVVFHGLRLDEGLSVRYGVGHSARLNLNKVRGTTQVIG